MNRRQFTRMCAFFCLAGLPAGRLLSAPAVNAVDSTGIVLDSLFLRHYMGPGHPESPRRLKSIMQALEHSNMLQDLQMLDYTNSVESIVNLVHTAAHIDSIRNHYPATYPVALAVVGAVVAGVDAVMSGNARNVFCATRPPGHHAANTGREEGFCFFNAVAVAARYAQVQHKVQNILIVDWDYHHGNGTELLFYDDPSVLYFSTHDFHAYPGTGDPARTGAGKGRGYNINVPLDCGASDEDIILAFREKLLPAANNFRPELILVSAGFDSRVHDTLGCFNITDNGYVVLTKLVMEIARKYCNGRIVSVLEGGYNLDGLASGVMTHIRTLNNRII